MSFLTDRRRSARAANDKFSTPDGLLPQREPRRSGVVDHLGGEERAKDIEKNGFSIYGEEERKDLSAKLDAEPEAAMPVIGKLSRDYEESKGPSAKKAERRDDPDRPFADALEFTGAINSADYKRSKARRAEVAGRASLWNVIATNRPSAPGQLGDDLRRKGAAPTAGASQARGNELAASAFWTDAAEKPALETPPVLRVHDQRVQTIDPLIQGGYVPHTHGTISGRASDHGRRGPRGLEGAGGLLGLGLAGALLYAAGQSDEKEGEQSGKPRSETPGRQPEDERKPGPPPPPFSEPKDTPDDDEDDDDAAYFRVQRTGDERVEVLPDGGILIKEKGGMLFVSVEDPHHARYYLRAKRPGAGFRVVAFDVPLDLHRRIVADLIPQRNAKKDKRTRNRSQFADERKPGVSIGVARPWFGELQMRANDAETIDREEFFKRYGRQDPERPWTTRPRGQNAPGFRR